MSASAPRRWHGHPRISGRRHWLALLGSSMAGAWPGLPRAAPAVAQGPAQAGALSFPADHGAHPDARTEWWYVTGWLHAGEAGPDAPPTHGFQVTFFRSRTGFGHDHPSAFAARQLLMAHAALSDVQTGRQVHDQRLARAGLQWAEAASGDARVRLRDWWLERQGGPADAPWRARMDSASAGFGLDLRLTPTQPLLLQGDAGWSRKGPRPEQASRYYSLPQLAVHGHLQQGGTRQPVRGRAWLDHEWSDQILPAEAVGWDWIGINLDDGSALTAFRLRRADGSALWAGGSWRRAGQITARPFAPHEVAFGPGRTWTSPATGARYPVAWEVRTPAGHWQVRSAFDAQELDARASTGTVYWEGLCELLDPAGRRVGRGYLEMTGYAGRLRL